jgi:isopentenyldiphosphate isomerase
MEEKVYPPITVVDEHDDVIGYMDLFAAIALGHIRRVACVFVLDADGRILIQRRAADVLSPNLLDFSAAGHVNKEQDYASAAEAELREELGVTDVELTPIVPPFYTPGFYNGIFKVVLSKENVLTLNPEEVTSVMWTAFDELTTMIAHHPQQFTEPFLAAWPHVCDKIKI